MTWQTSFHQNFFWNRSWETTLLPQKKWWLRQVLFLWFMNKLCLLKWPLKTIGFSWQWSRQWRSSNMMGASHSYETNLLWQSTHDNQGYWTNTMYPKYFKTILHICHVCTCTSIKLYSVDLDMVDKAWLWSYHGLTIKVLD